MALAWCEECNQQLKPESENCELCERLLVERAVDAIFISETLGE